MIDVEALGEHDLLRADHVAVVVLGEAHVEAVGGLGGFAVTDVVGEDEEEFGDVEGFAGAEEDVGELGEEKIAGEASGAVEQEDGIVDLACGVAVRRAEREVVELELGEGFAGVELEIFDGVDAVFGGPFGGRGDGLGLGEGSLGGGGLRVCRGREGEEGEEEGAHAKSI